MYFVLIPAFSLYINTFKIFTVFIYFSQNNIKSAYKICAEVFLKIVKESSFQVASYFERHRKIKFSKLLKVFSNFERRLYLRRDCRQNKMKTNQ